MKKFELLSIEPIHGAINIPVLQKMNNGEIAKAILKAVTRNELQYTIKEWRQIESFCKTLQNDAEGLFIDPCENCPDCFVLAFGFKEYNKDAAIFFSVFAFALFGESIINNLI